MGNQKTIKRHRSLFTHKVAQAKDMAMAKEARFSQFTPRLPVNSVRE
jgi:hypothetical protein